MGSVDTGGMYEATFRVGDAAGPIATAGRDVRVDLWCTDHCDLVRAVGPDAGRVVDDLAERVGVADRVTDGTEHVAVTETCFADARDDSVDRYVGAHGCLVVPPLRYEDGERVPRVLALDADALAAVYRDLIADGHDVRVTSKRAVDAGGGAPVTDGPLLDPAGIVPELTARQREVVAVAVAAGYYRIPRAVTTAEIADEVGIARRTAADHLRRAERKIVTSVVEYL